ncbi:hypothetical protein PSCICL_24530 [Pseudomonas cichorii]|nr:hypothetical protein [Pseudomonas cichorii]GFM71461.1 hypothetical protein PSCICL_24530 [Pseudomonas cichorii]
MECNKLENEVVIWEGAPGGFGNLEVDASGSITWVPDASLGHEVFRYFKPADPTSYRCESRNIKIDGIRYQWQSNKTYRLRWKSRLTKIDSVYGDFVIFQWKSYPGTQQSYPVLFTAVRDEVRVIYVDPEGKWHTVWTHKTVDGEWNSYCLTLHLSEVDGQGWFELEYNGVAQLLAGKSRFEGRTLDGSTEPKWGVYNRDNPAHELEQFVGDMTVSIVE